MKMVIQFNIYVIVMLIIRRTLVNTNYQVIGIHKGGAENEKNYNLGTLLKLPIEEFKRKKKV